MNGKRLQEWILPDPFEITTDQSLHDWFRASGEAGVPIGSGSFLTRGLAPSTPVRALDLSRLNALVEHAHEDLTVTVQAGMTMRDLDAVLAEKNQWLPLDFPDAGGTVGGLVATDRRGPLAGALGNVRDYLIGVRFLDGRGREVQAGGRVVKNVAGYDFMKLLIGSLGELGILVEATFKVLPRPDTWGGLMLPNPQAGVRRDTIRNAPRRWFPTGLWRGNLGHGECLWIVFAGSSDRVRAQVEGMHALWGTVAKRLDEDAVLEVFQSFPMVSAPRDRPIGWGGALPSYLVELDHCRAFGEDRWLSDLLAGHLWWFPESVGYGGQVEAVRAALREGEGHLHLDLPPGHREGDTVWGWEPGEEATLWRGLKNVLDPDRRLVSGRLPGGV
jgi:glycolate oxidase FAD binding subunit